MSELGEPGVILAADDDEDILELVCLTLEQAGHETLRASDGEEALQLALRRQGLYEKAVQSSGASGTRRDSASRSLTDCLSTPQMLEIWSFSSRIASRRRSIVAIQSRCRPVGAARPSCAINSR